MSTFKELGVSDNLIKGIKEINIHTPSEIQERTIPTLLTEKTDVVAQAQTGTGKTAAFGLPILQKLNPKLSHVQAVILTPTRELGQQIAKQLFKYTKYTDKVFVEAVFGGEHIGKQIDALARPTHVVVATPGRLIDLLKRRAVDIKKIKTLVLDEADEMLSMGFKNDIEYLMNFTDNGSRSLWLFSATLPHEVTGLVNGYFSDKVLRVHVDKKNVVNKNIEHQYVVCAIEDKPMIISNFIASQHGGRGVLFCRTKAGAENLSNLLKGKNVSVDYIHGDLLQKERDKAMRAFRNEKVQVLVATDVAARGIDVEGLAFVIHHQLPEQDEYYTHRSGRTGRAGKKGISLCLITQREEERVKKLGSKLGIFIRAYEE